DVHRNNKTLETNDKYNQLSEKFYTNKDDKDKANEIQNEMIDTMAEKKLYSKNDETIQLKSKTIHDINEREKERLENKTEQAKKFEKLNGKSMMWKIVEQESLNSEHLTKNDDNMLDARVNASNINTQVANNNRSQYSSKQVTRNTSYNNAYKNLENSKQVTNVNYEEDRENEVRKTDNDKRKNIRR
ncbi:hypothetical protein IR073_06940, partial [Gemella sp. 19428wG2_WT2a]|nr:hypothetical protein [Gemella sp. 19428wG2_WT2a]